MLNGFDAEDSRQAPLAGDNAPGAVVEGKFACLKAILNDMGSVLVAFSGGVDSTFLLKVACDVLGDRAAAITATSPTYPEREFDEAKTLASLIGARHIVVESNELLIPNFSGNTEKRCYYCKTELFSISRSEAARLGYSHVVDGFNADDLKDFRPGHAAAEELRVRSPLCEAGMAKHEIRALSRALGLPTWDKPNMACLSSRFPYGTEITLQRLEMVGEAEEFLRGLGLRQFRVRYHDGIARIEVDGAGFAILLDAAVRASVAGRLKALGFTYVTIDIEGYRTGSMNEGLQTGTALKAL